MTTDRRTQYLVAGSSVAPTSETEDEAEDEETGFRRGPLYDSDEEEADVIADSRTRHRQDSFVANFDWDEEGEGEPSQLQTSVSPSPRPLLSSRRFDTGNTIQPGTVIRSGEVKSPIQELPRNETSPLLSRKSSSVQERFAIQDSAAKSYGTPSHDPNLLSPPPMLRRRSSAASHKSHLQQYSFGGKSTYGQSVSVSCFNHSNYSLKIDCGSCSTRSPSFWVLACCPSLSLLPTRVGEWELSSL